MKKKKSLCIENTSLDRRNLTRHPMPQPSFSFTDKKKSEDRTKCRKKPSIQDGE